MDIELPNHYDFTFLIKMLLIFQVKTPAYTTTGDTTLCPSRTCGEFVASGRTTFQQPFGEKTGFGLCRWI